MCRSHTCPCAGQAQSLLSEGKECRFSSYQGNQQRGASTSPLMRPSAAGAQASRQGVSRVSQEVKHRLAGQGVCREQEGGILSRLTTRPVSTV